LNALAIFGVPRSGTSWLGQIFNSHPAVAYRYQPLFSYAFKNRLNENSSLADIEGFYNDLLQTDDDFVLQKRSISGEAQEQFTKVPATHLVWKEVRYLHLMPTILENSHTKIIGIVRHPGGVLASWLQAPREFNPEWDFRQEWRYANLKNQAKPEEFYGFDRWKTAFARFLELQKRYPERVFLISYEHLVISTAQVVQELFRFCGLEMNQQVRNFIEKSTTTQINDPYAVFKVKQNIEDWHQVIPLDIIDEIEKELAFFKGISNFDWK
jgi:hypothetical protein